MKKDIDAILLKISEDYLNNIDRTARHYLEVDIGKKADQLGCTELGRRYRNVYAVVPLKRPAAGMKVRIDGRTFVDYAQFESGVAVPGYVAREAGLAHASYTPLDSMILNFT